MKSRILLSLMFSVFSVTAFAQSVPWSQQGRRVKQAAYWRSEGHHWFSEDKLTVSNAAAIKLFASDVFDPNQSVLNAGIEYFFSDRFGVEFAAGIGLGDKPWLAKRYDYRVHVRKDYRIALEPRIYWNNKNASRYYFALSGWYRRKEMKINGGNFIAQDGWPGYSFSSGNLNQDIAGVALQLGRQFFIGEHFIIELATGLGYLTFNNYFSNLKDVVQLNDYEYYSLGGLLNTTALRNEWEHGAGGLHLPSHIKLGFVIP